MRGGHWHCRSGVGIGAEIEAAVSAACPKMLPTVGNVRGMSPKAAQACLDMKSRVAVSLKYTICRVSMVSPDGEVPAIRSARAPTMSIPLSLAAVICMVTGTR